MKINTKQTDKDLEAYTSYVYQIMATNQVDLSTKSPSSDPTRSGESPPDGVPPPTFSMVTGSGVRVEVGKPLKSNGVLRKYVVKVRKQGEDRWEQV